MAPAPPPPPSGPQGMPGAFKIVPGLGDALHEAMKKISGVEEIAPAAEGLKQFVIFCHCKHLTLTIYLYPIKAIYLNQIIVIALYMTSCIMQSANKFEHEETLTSGFWGGMGAISNFTNI